jgi:hypothetical protein
MMQTYTMSHKVPTLFFRFLLFLSIVESTVSQGEEHSLDRPLTFEDAIMMQELEWAEQAMEDYKGEKSTMPIRSSVRAAHMHTKEWKQECMKVFSASDGFLL